ncbi:GerAB/ArcD/ProY family transporter [Ruminococcus callidus]|uniref:GerAB/ArcD/ProY family transporter n=1 Tax=Ruminococcus callidus TaxID=40519 RepID=UPI00352179EB
MQHIDLGRSFFHSHSEYLFPYIDAIIFIIAHFHLNSKSARRKSKTLFFGMLSVTLLICFLLFCKIRILDTEFGIKTLKNKLDKFAVLCYNI